LFQQGYKQFERQTLQPDTHSGAPQFSALHVDFKEAELQPSNIILLLRSCHQSKKNFFFAV
jgi:hypothetical protein